MADSTVVREIDGGDDAAGLLPVGALAWDGPTPLARTLDPTLRGGCQGIVDGEIALLRGSARCVIADRGGRAWRGDGFRGDRQGGHAGRVARAGGN